MTAKFILLIMLFVTLTSKGQSIDFQGSGNLNNVKGLYWYPTIFFSAINASNNTFNIIKLRNPDRPDKYKSNAIFSIISGSLQTALGVANVTSKDKNAYIPTSINIGIGVTTIVTSVMRLARKTPPKETKLTYNFFYLPAVDNNTSTVGLRIVRRLN